MSREAITPNFNRARILCFMNWVWTILRILVSLMLPHNSTQLNYPSSSAKHYAMLQLHGIALSCLQVVAIVPLVASTFIQASNAVQLVVVMGTCQSMTLSVTWPSWPLQEPSVNGMQLRRAGRSVPSGGPA